MYNTQEVSTTSILALFDTDKAQRASFVADLVGRIESGDINPLVVHTQVKAMEDIINQLTSRDEKKNKNVASAKKYHSLLLSEASKHGKAFDFHNAKFEEKETGVSYDFAKCEDVMLEEMHQQLAELKKRVTARETMLKNIPPSGMVDPDNGNLIYSPSKTSTTSIVTTLK